MSAKANKTLIKSTGLLIGLAVVGAFCALAGPISQASASTSLLSSSTYIPASVSSTCLKREIDVTPQASGKYNGQWVATLVYARAQGSFKWTPMMTNWRLTQINPFKSFDDGFGMTTWSQVSVDLYSSPLRLSTPGGYFEVGVAFQWWDPTAKQWGNYEFVQETTYHDQYWFVGAETGTCFT